MPCSRTRRLEEGKPFCCGEVMGREGMGTAATVARRNAAVVDGARSKRCDGVTKVRGCMFAYVCFARADLSGTFACVLLPSGKEKRSVLCGRGGVARVAPWKD